jgi:TolB-like protein/class 3 adenylate cyclase
MERRLAAILAADVVGYSRLMGADEAGTLDMLKTLRKDLVAPEIAKHKGRVVKLMGDGLLAEFGSVVEAVECAVAIQTGAAERNEDCAPERQVVLRIGINLGDIIVEGRDIYGDGVNVASRLEGLADPGGICLSGDAYRQVKGKLNVRFEDLGERKVKNIAEPIHTYRIHWQAPNAAITPLGTELLPLPDKPSIAVLPFTNMSGDPEQEYFADGMVEEVITALSRLRWLFVIARNSSFTYKGRAVDVKQVGRELGVRYVLEGSVRRAGNKVRITGQLIDTATGAHLWADRFDGTLEDVFDLQDQVTASVVGAIAPKLEQAEIERAKRKPTDSLDAYDYYLRGLACVHRWTQDDNGEALRHFARAIQLDPDFAAAYGMAARCYSQSKVSGWLVDRSRAIAEVERLAKRAATLGKDDAVALNAAGMALAYVVGDLDGGRTLIEQALALDPNQAWAWLFSGWVNVWLGEPEIAIEHVARAMRLSPYDPHAYNMQAAIASAHFFAGRYSEAFSWAKMAAREQPNHLIAVCIVAASGAMAGRLEDAKMAVTHLRQLEPLLHASNLNDLIPCRRSDDLASLAKGLREAGLPE